MEQKVISEILNAASKRFPGYFGRLTKEAKSNIAYDWYYELDGCTAQEVAELVLEDFTDLTLMLKGLGGAYIKKRVEKKRQENKWREEYAGMTVAQLQQMIIDMQKEQLNAKV